MKAKSMLKQQSNNWKKHIIIRYLSLRAPIIKIKSVVWQWDFTKDSNFYIEMAAKYNFN